MVLKKGQTGNWFICLVTEHPDDDLPEKPALSTLDASDRVGVDFRVLSYIHTSDDTPVNMLDLSDKYDRYAREQRKLDRKEDESDNGEKQHQTVATAKRQINACGDCAPYRNRLDSWKARRRRRKP